MNAPITGYVRRTVDDWAEEGIRVGDVLKLTDRPSHHKPDPELVYVLSPRFDRPVGVYAFKTTPYDPFEHLYQ